MAKTAWIDWFFFYEIWKILWDFVENDDKIKIIRVKLCQTFARGPPEFL